MLRPATPLSILLLVSFILLLLSTLSAPIIKSIPLARLQDVNFGVFGWCKDDGSCSGIKVGWDPSDVLSNSANNDFNLPANTRKSLYALLIVHPIAALCNLIALGLAVAAHLHSPSHSARYLLGLLIFLLPTLLITLLAFLVDILLFVPAIKWAGWIVLASTILITISGVVTCAMRRTLVSRKARKKRIAENAEMSGENFYARQAQENKMIGSQPSTESKAPLVHGGPGADNLPAFHTFNAAQSIEERQAPPRPAPPPHTLSPTVTDNGSDRYYGAPVRSNSGGRPAEFGAAMSPTRSPEDRGPPMPYPPRGGYGPPRGRGGYPPRGGMAPRGGFGPRGPPPQAFGRGGYPVRGRGYPMGPPGPGRGQLPRGPPPPGYPPHGGNLPPARYGPTGDMAGPLPPNEAMSAGYVQTNEAAFDPSQYTRRSSSLHDRQSPHGIRGPSPGMGHRSPSPPPDMPNMNQGLHPDHEAEPTLPVLPPEPDEYVPPRAGWSNTNHEPEARGITRVNSGGSDYMEDVDPRFAQTNSASVPQDVHHTVPSVLVSGRQPTDPSPEPDTNHLPPAHSYENLPGARSPAGSEISEFTSISQRGVNPNWRPGHGGEFNSFGPGRQRQQQQRQDVLFQGNPDFEIPGMAPPRTRGPAMRGGYGGPPPRLPPPSALGVGSGDGRYPSESPPPPMPGSVREI